jgi:hypothetical protein
MGPLSVEDRITSTETRPLAPFPPEEEMPVASAPPPAPAEIPDWLQELAPPEAAAPEALPPAEAPTWEEREVPEEEEPEIPAPAAAEVPDWLQEIAPPEAAAPEVLSPAEAPIWEEREVPEEEEPEIPAPAAAEVPDWLQEIAPTEAAAPEALLPEEPALGEAEELEAVGEAELEIPAAEEPPPEEPEEIGELGAPELEMPAPTPAEVPDWLQELAPPEAAAPAAIAAAELALEELEEPEETEPEILAPAPAEFPDWLQEIAPAEAAAPEAPPLEAEPALERLEEAAPEPPTAEVEIPDWLREIAAQKEISEEEGPTEGIPVAAAMAGLAAGTEGLARAAIPEWLEALRPQPAEAEVTLEEEPAETMGLLEGLRGVLAPASVLTAPEAGARRPVPETSEASLSRAQLLQSILSQPTQAQQPTAARRDTRVAERLQRWLVGAVLLIAVGAPLLAPLFLPAASIPTLTSPAQSPAADGRMDFQNVTRLYEAIDGLGSGDAVMVAFEYGPPEADEINPVAEPVLRHLLGQGANLSVVSTRPEGAAVAAGLLGSIVTPQSGFRQNQVELLDYRMGDAAGVARLLTAATPRPALVVVLTAQPGSLRWWVEQTHALFGDDVPIVAGMSAALEPLAAPYLDATVLQLEGAVSGLSGAAAYETLNGSAGQATRRLNALATGQAALAALVLLGAVIFTFGNTPRRRE